MLLFTIAAASFGGPAAASGSGTDAKRIRTTSPRIVEALQAGTSQSKTLRDLIDRIEESDLIIHITPLPVSPGPVGGEMHFAAATPGTRYLRISIKHALPQPQLIAMLAHELQHCVEVAEAPHVVNAESMREHYQSIGFSPEFGRHETSRAREAGVRALREVNGTRSGAPKSALTTTARR